MTRINVVPPKELSDKHLIAEYREITRVPGCLRRSLSRKGKPFTIDEIPLTYTLGSGHVKFFYNKMLFLRNRFLSLVSEMRERGFEPKYDDGSIFDGFSEIYNNDYIPTENASLLNRTRIKERSR